MNALDRQRLGATLVGVKEYKATDEQGQDAVAMLALHLRRREEQERPGSFAAFDVDEESGYLETILTPAHIRRLLIELGTRRYGRDYARTILGRLVEDGWIEDTGKVKLPSVPEEKWLQAHRYKCNLPRAGGRHSQPPGPHSYWWRVFRLLRHPRLTISPSTGTSWFARSHWGSTKADDAFGEASLCLTVRRQGLLKPPKKPQRFAPGSVQWAFQHTGPP